MPDGFGLGIGDARVTLGDQLCALVSDRAELLRLESEMNRYLPLYPHVTLCLYDICVYDIERFGADVASTCSARTGVGSSAPRSVRTRTT